MECQGNNTPNTPPWALIFLVRGALLTSLQQGLNSPPHLQWEESRVIMQGIHLAPPHFAAGQGFVARARAATSYASSWEVCPPTYLSCGPTDTFLGLAYAPISLRTHPSPRWRLRRVGRPGPLASARSQSSSSVIHQRLFP